MIRKTLLTLALLWMQAAALQAQVTLTGQAAARTDFELAAADSGAAVCYDAGDAAVVETAAGLFAADVARVTGREIPVVAGQELGSGGAVHPVPVVGIDFIKEAVAITL